MQESDKMARFDMIYRRYFPYIITCQLILLVWTLVTWMGPAAPDCQNTCRGLVDAALKRNKKLAEFKESALKATEKDTPKPLHQDEMFSYVSRINSSAQEFLRKWEGQCQSNIWNPDASEGSSQLQVCSCAPETLTGEVKVNLTVPSWFELYVAYRNVKPAGRWQPMNCVSRQRVTIIIPARDRDSHLKILLRHLHPILQRQQLNYAIFAVEQMGSAVHNKGAVMDAAFTIANKYFPFDCVIFHDVDLLMLNDHNIYQCTSSGVHHLGVFIQKFKFKLPYDFLIGGALAFRKKDFEKVNGYSTRYYGWGGEDDDMYERLRLNSIKVYRFPFSVSRYQMIAHQRDGNNPMNQDSGKLNQIPREKLTKEGVSTIKYIVRNVEQRHIYTLIRVEIFTHLTNYNTFSGGCNTSDIYFGKHNEEYCAIMCNRRFDCECFVIDHAHNICRLKDTVCTPAQNVDGRKLTLYVKKVEPLPDEASWYEKERQTFTETEKKLNMDLIV